MQTYNNYSKTVQCGCQAIHLLGDSDGLMLLKQNPEIPQ